MGGTVVGMNWQEFSMADLAAAWMHELDGTSDAEAASNAVVLMNFTAPAAIQWEFLQAAIDRATTDHQLYDIAAGPFEHLLGFHGDAYIELVEERCAADPKFARMTTAAYRHRMSDAVWQRVQDIQNRVADPL